MRLIYNWVIIAAMVAATIIATTWVAQNAGTIELTWLGYAIKAPIWLGISVILALILLVTLPIWLMMKLRFWRKKSSLQTQLKSNNKGITEVTQTIVALMMGDVDSAGKHLAATGKLIGKNNSLYQLLDSHVAIKSQPQTATIALLEKLQEYNETRPLSFNAITNAAIQNNNYEMALENACKAYEINPRNLSVAIQYFGLLLKNNKFEEAINLVGKMFRAKLITKQRLRKFQAITYYVNFKASDGNYELLNKAFASSADFVPAYGAIINAKNLDKSNAWKMVFAAWEKSPHPNLRKIIIKYFKDEHLEKLGKKIAKMVAMHPTHVESELLLADFAMLEKKHEDARVHLQAALKIQPQQQIYHSLSQLEHEYFGDEDAAKKWEQRANEQSTANPAWLCQKCGFTHNNWQLECDNCHSFASIEYDSPLAPTNSPQSFPLHLP